jgi:group II intron reverse transcriptase/maturase
MKTNIERVAVKAQQEKELCFTSLAHHLTSDTIWNGLCNIPANTSVGVDGYDVKQAKEEFPRWVETTINAIHSKGYKAPPVRRVYIPKPGKNKMRPIGVPTVLDRSLQVATTKILSSIYEQDFLENSYGGRPGKSAHQAIATLTSAIASQKVSWVYEADLENFFGSINHGWVLRFLEHRVGDPRIISLIKRWLKAGVMEEGLVTSSSIGTPQGGPISVLISNLYLHYALDLWVEKIVKPKLKGEVYYVRYIDDFVLCFQYLSDAQSFEQVLPKRLNKFDLKLEPTKTRLVSFGRFARRDSIRLNEKLSTIYFLGFNFYCSLNLNGRFRIGCKTEKGRFKRSVLKMKQTMLKRRHESLETQRKIINIILSGHYRYYGIGGNFNSLKQFHRITIYLWLKTLKTRSQKSRLTWDKFNKILKAFPILQPKIHVTYRNMRDMADL